MEYIRALKDLPAHPCWSSCHCHIQLARKADYFFFILICCCFSGIEMGDSDICSSFF